MLYMRIGKYCEPITDVRQDGNRISYKNYKGQYYIGDRANVLKDPKLTNRKIGTNIFELAQ